MSDFEREPQDVDYELLELDVSYSDIGREIIEAPRTGVYLGELELSDLSEVELESQKNRLDVESYTVSDTSLVQSEATPEDIVEALKTYLEQTDDNA